MAGQRPGATSGGKGERTRRRLLDAAAEEIARRGIPGASLTAIATAAGVQAGSVYFHFASKADLVEAVLDEGLTRTLEHLDAALAGLPERASAARRLDAAIRAHADAVHHLRAYTVVVLAPDVLRADPAASRPRASAPDAAAGHRALLRTYRDRWTGLVVAAQSEGALPGDLDPRLVRDLLFGALNAVGLAGGPVEPVAHAVRAMLSLDSASGAGGVSDGDSS